MVKDLCFFSKKIGEISYTILLNTTNWRSWLPAELHQTKTGLHSCFRDRRTFLLPLRLVLAPSRLFYWRWNNSYGSYESIKMVGRYDTILVR